VNAARVTLRACAKINWTLEVLGRRSDGYHEVRTILQTIDLADELALRSPDRSGAGRDTLRVAVPAGWDVPVGEGNLIEKARTLLAASHPSWRWAETLRVELQKCIPPAAGLGGGSSDAAAFLRGCECLRASTEAEALERLATRIGSDVPFFLRGGTQLASGRGEVLEALPNAPTTWLVLVTPPLSLGRKTERLYSLLEAEHFSDGSRTDAVAQALRQGRAPEPASLANTFEQVAGNAFPGLAGYRRSLTETCGFALLSGAGPALFSPVADRGAAEEAVAALTKQRVPAQIARTMTAAESTAYRLG
jgi:4-diphosphocytidyl-2-C-methyl-D-erythritol kinase